MTIETYYRIQDIGDSVEHLLQTDNVSQVWVGMVWASCPVEECIQGIVWVDENSEDARSNCETCKGEGMIDDSRRPGVSVCRDIDTLGRYFGSRGGELEDAIVVECRGYEVGEDWDHRDGADLIQPTEIVRTMTLEECGLEWLREETD